MAKPRPASIPKPDASPARVGLPRMPALYGLKTGRAYLPWRHAQERLERSRNYWVCTMRPDGRPHAMPVWGIWLDSSIYFGTARTSRKGLNLARNRHVTVHLESGDDVVIVEGEVSEVCDSKTLEGIVAGYAAKYPMPLVIGPENVIFRVTPRVVMAWSEKGFVDDATRWEFVPGGH